MAKMALKDRFESLHHIPTYMLSKEIFNILQEDHDYRKKLPTKFKSLFLKEDNIGIKDVCSLEFFKFICKMQEINNIKQEDNFHLEVGI